MRKHDCHTLRGARDSTTAPRLCLNVSAVAAFQSRIATKSCDGIDDQSNAQLHCTLASNSSATALAIGNDAVSPGDSMPSKCINPGMP